MKKKLKTWIKRLFCKHAYKLHSDDQYAIISYFDGHKKTFGFVNMAIYICKHCEHNKVVMHNRIWIDEKWTKG